MTTPFTHGHCACLLYIVMLHNTMMSLLRGESLMIAFAKMEDFGPKAIVDLSTLFIEL